MMRVKSLQARNVFAILAGLALTAGTAHAKFSTERPGSILIFPKVVNAAGRDSTIQITNTSNVVRYAHCFYVNGAPRNPNLPPNAVTNPPIWQVTDFDITLTRQQPTHWLGSAGRAVDPTDPVQGLDPGLVPPLPPGFTGELVCAEVDETGVYPVAGNALKGEATISAGASGDVIKYNGIAVQGLNPDGDLTLALNDVEYSACPAGLHYNFQAEGGSDSVVDSLGSGASLVNSNLVLVPCAANFETMAPVSVTVAFNVRNEFEENFSASTRVDCWGSFNFDASSALGGAFGFDSLLTDYGYARITPTGVGNGVGVIGVASTRRADANTGASGTSASNLFFMGNDGGSCADGTPCGTDSDCASGTCAGVTNLPGANIVLRGF